MLSPSPKEHHVKAHILIFGAFIALISVTGCFKKTVAPAVYTAKTPAETAIIAYIKLKSPTLTVTNISLPNVPKIPGADTVSMPQLTKQYRVEAADAGDASLVTSGMVFYDEKRGQVDERMTPPMSPPAKKE